MAISLNPMALGRALLGRNDEEGVPPFLPKQLPLNDESYLLEFHTDNLEHAAQMEPVLKRLERELKTKVRRLNIYRKRDLYTVLEQIGHDECGQLPFYYNRRTGQAICGPTTYMNLKRWGMGDLRAVFMDPPEGLNQYDEEAFQNKRDIGTKGKLQERLKRLEKRQGGDRKGKK